MHPHYHRYSACSFKVSWIKLSCLIVTYEFAVSTLDFICKVFPEYLRKIILINPLSITVDYKGTIPMLRVNLLKPIGFNVRLTTITHLKGINTNITYQIEYTLLWLLLWFYSVNIRHSMDFVNSLFNLVYPHYRARVLLVLYMTYFLHFRYILV